MLAFTVWVIGEDRQSEACFINTISNKLKFGRNAACGNNKDKFVLYRDI